MKKLILLTLCALLPLVSKGAILLTISEDETGVFMSAAGTYDMTQTISTFSLGFTTPSAGIISELQMYGWTSVLAKFYVVNSTGELSGNAFILKSTTESTTIPFYLQRSNDGVAGIAIFDTAPATGFVDNHAYFEGYSLQSLGMVPGESMTWYWPGDSATVTVIPEPTVSLVGLISAFAFLRRRR